LLAEEIANEQERVIEQFQSITGKLK